MGVKDRHVCCDTQTHAHGYTHIWQAQRGGGTMEETGQLGFELV